LKFIRLRLIVVRSPQHQPCLALQDHNPSIPRLERIRNRTPKPSPTDDRDLIRLAHDAFAFAFLVVIPQRCGGICFSAP
jgi:hypothetical protein